MKKVVLHYSYVACHVPIRTVTDKRSKVTCKVCIKRMKGSK